MANDPLPVRTVPDLDLVAEPPPGAGSRHPSADARRVPVLLPYPFPGPFDYAVPADLDPAPGDIVLVPLNRREEIGVVWHDPAGDQVPAHKLKPIVAIIETAPMGASLRQFVD